MTSNFLSSEALLKYKIMGLIDRLRPEQVDIVECLKDSDRVVSLISKPTETGGATLCSAGSTGCFGATRQSHGRARLRRSPWKTWNLPLWRTLHGETFRITPPVHVGNLWSPQPPSDRRQVRDASSADPAQLRIWTDFSACVQDRRIAGRGNTRPTFCWQADSPKNSDGESG